MCEKRFLQFRTVGYPSDSLASCLDWQSRHFLAAVSHAKRFGGYKIDVDLLVASSLHSRLHTFAPSNQIKSNQIKS